MQVTQMSIEGAFVFSPVLHMDDRGSFHEWFREDIFREATGHPLHLAQANMSISAAGAVRGIHFAELPPGQAKYVTCTNGAIFDVVVDIRTGSPTFGQWEAVTLDRQNHSVVYLSEGLGHAFMALEDHSVVNYLCSAPYSPGQEHGISPLDPDLAIAWPTIDPAGNPLAPRLSPKDSAAPSLAAVRDSAVLPSLEQAADWLRSLRASVGQ